MMDINAWKQFFSNTTLRQGERYYRKGWVNDLRFNGNEITAEVWDGDDTYDVGIWMNGTTVEEMSCSCPCAEEEPPCKHMAAVLHAWMISAYRGDVKPEFTPPLPLEEAVQRLSAESMRKLLLKQAEDNRVLQEIIHVYATGTISDSQKWAWKRELMVLQQKHDKIASMDDNVGECFRYLKRLDEYLQAKCDFLVDAGLLSDAVDLLSMVYSYAVGCLRDYEVGDKLDVESHCIGYLKHIINITDPTFRSELYERCLRECGGRISDHNDHLWQEALLGAFDDTEHIQRNLVLLEEAIAKADRGEQECGIVYLVQTKVRLMRALGMDERNVVAFRSRYRQYDAIRRAELQEALEHGKMDEAVRLLMEFKQNESVQGLARQKIVEELISLYEQLNDQSAYERELQEYIFAVPQRDLTYVRKLKAAQKADSWQDTLSRILQAETMKSLYLDLMAEEGMYRKLLNELEHDVDLDGLQKYEEILKSHFPEEMRNIIFACLRRAITCASTRSAYERIVTRLKRMKTYPGGEEMADQLAAEWRSSYKRRSALMDELKRAGFS